MSEWDRVLERLKCSTIDWNCLAVWKMWKQQRRKKKYTTENTSTTHPLGALYNTYLLNYHECRYSVSLLDQNSIEFQRQRARKKKQQQHTTEYVELARPKDSKTPKHRKNFYVALGKTAIQVVMTSCLNLSIQRRVHTQSADSSCNLATCA